VAVDLALSHWTVAREVAWPFMAVPELIQFDDARYNRHTAGVDRYFGSEIEPVGWRVKRADLDARPSRRARLSDQMGYFVFKAAPERLAEVRDALALARDRIAILPDDGDPLNGLRATAERTWRMTHAANWPLTKIVMPDGSEIEAHQYQSAPEEKARFDAARHRSDANMYQLNVRLKIQTADTAPSDENDEDN
jgi:hypothetical protein